MRHAQKKATLGIMLKLDLHVNEQVKQHITNIAKGTTDPGVDCFDQ